MFNKKIKTVVKINGMSCIHCSNKVKTVLEKIDSVSKVKVLLDKKCAIIYSKKKLDKEEIKNKIKDIDYKVVEIYED